MFVPEVALSAVVVYVVPLLYGGLAATQILLKSSLVKLDLLFCLDAFNVSHASNISAFNKSLINVNASCPLIICLSINSIIISLDVINIT
jgi:hypothetical protein